MRQILWHECLPVQTNKKVSRVENGQPNSSQIGDCKLKSRLGSAYPRRMGYQRLI